MKYRYLILAVFILVGCNSTKLAQKRLKRLKNNHSELFEADTIYQVVTDTFIVIVPKYQFDTIVGIRDTVVIENERLKTVITVRDSLYFVRSEIKEIPVPIVKTDTIVRIKEKVILETQKVKYIPIWLIILVIGVTILYVITYIRYINVSD